MYSKYKFQKLVNKHKDRLIEVLQLKTWKIRFHFYVEGSVKLRNLGMKKSNCTNCHAITYIGNKSADVVLFYDMAKNKKDAYSTLVHELLHCCMYKLSSLVTIKADKAHRAEERIVSILETLVKVK